MPSPSSPQSLASEVKPQAPALNKHQRKTQAMELRLLKAARKIFARDGFEAASIDDIAAAAGHTRGAFYAHFKTKEDLFLAIIEQEIAHHAKVMRELLEKCRTDAQKTLCMRDYYASRAADRQWSILLIEFKLYALRRGKLRARLAEAHRQAKIVFKPELEPLFPAAFQGPPEVQEAKRLALEAMLTGVVLETAYDPKRVSEEGVQSILRQAFDSFQKITI